MVTAVVLTKNEEKNIVDCLDSLSFCDEIIVVDDKSQDRTVEIAKSYNANVFVHSLGDNFSSQRNYGLEKAKNEWVLFIDADERVSSILAKEISYKISENKKEGFYVKRDDVLWGRRLTHGEVGNTYLLRLGRKDRGKWKGKVHEKWELNGKKEYLKNSLDHYPHQTVGEFLKEIDFYTDLRAKELLLAGEKTSWYLILLYPKAKFFLNYILKLGFLDGLPGFLFAIMMSFHSFLVRGKLWTLNQTNSK